MTQIKRKIKLSLAALDGNAFMLLGAFQRQARKENWTPEEIKTVMIKAKSGDYDNLVSTLMEHCEDEDL